MAHYKPRMAALLTLPVMGRATDRRAQSTSTEAITYTVRVQRAEWEFNDHNQADSVELTLDYAEAGVDPRLLTSGQVAFYIGNADERGQWYPSDENLRFIGPIVEAERHLSEDGRKIVVKAHDFTSLFLRSKPFPARGVPDYSQTLQGAWERICDFTGAWDAEASRVVSTVQALKGALVLVDVDPGLTLGKAVAQRLRSFGKVQAQPSDDAWTVWQRCVGSLGLISFFKLGACVVTSATDYYSTDDPPRFVWGRNILALDEKRDVATLNSKGVAIASFDANTGTTIEAFWPPKQASSQTQRGGFRAARKKTIGGAGKAVDVKEYEFFSYPGVTDEEILERCAQRVFEERSRQELQGGIRTAEMSVESLSGKSFDLLNLHAGDRLRVELDADVLSALHTIPSDSLRMQFLRDRGYAPGVAKLMVDNVGSMTRLTPEFLVRNVRGSLEIDDKGVNFELEIGFINRITITGEALPADS